MGLEVIKEHAREERIALREIHGPIVVRELATWAMIGVSFTRESLRDIAKPAPASRTFSWVIGPSLLRG